MSDTTMMLGKLAPSDAKRDAIHVAVVPVVAGCNLLAGDAVYVDKSQTAHPAGSTNTIGIVDPFLTKSVETGQRFWLFLKPGTVTGMRHSWAHPLFPPDEDEVSQKTISKLWLLAWCRRAWPYEEDEPNAMLGYLVGKIQSDGQVCFGTDWPSDVDRNSGTFTQEFWGHYERYTGKTRPTTALQFRCAC